MTLPAVSWAALYLDSSSVVKLYLRRVSVFEEGSEAVYHQAQAAEAVATARISYVEVRAALTRAWRDGRIVREEDYRGLVQDFNSDWPIFWAVSLSTRVVRLAGEMAETHALRGFDAVQLASALELRRRSDIGISFSSYDGRLRMAAEAEGLTIANNGGSS